MSSLPKRFAPFLQRAHSIFWKSGNPLYVIFFVTNRCNARCEHCFVDHDVNARLELTVDEYEIISQKMGPLLFAFFTGGDAFIREDLPDIVRPFARRNGLRKIQMPTAGAHAEPTVRLTREVLAAAPEAHLGVSISIDGIEEDHDRVRRVPGLFKRAMETYYALKDLAAHHDNLAVNVGLTFSAMNQDTALETYRYLRDKVGAGNILYTVVRGQPKNPASRFLDIAKLQRFNAEVDADIVHGGHGYSGFPFASFINAKNLVAHELNIDQLQNPHFRMPCYAGKLSAVVDYQGTIFPCEMLSKPLGSLRENDYDFQKIWKGHLAEEARKFIKDSKCFCTHECFLSTNILFTPSMMPTVLRKWASIEVGKRFGSRPNAPADAPVAVTTTTPEQVASNIVALSGARTADPE
ncbi:MAG TPA: radical SAM protein [Terriglobales bacterium]|nr:radical SAM protein [Terriglobales bacterium]